MKCCRLETPGVGGRGESVSPLSPRARLRLPGARRPRAAQRPFVFPSQADPALAGAPAGLRGGGGGRPGLRSLRKTGWLQRGVIFRLLRPLPSPFSSARTFGAFEAFIFPERTNKGASRSVAGFTAQRISVWFWRLVAHIAEVPGGALSADAALFSLNVLNSSFPTLASPLPPPSHTHTPLLLILEKLFLPASLPAGGRPGTAEPLCFPAAEPSRAVPFLLPGLTFGFAGLRALRRRSFATARAPFPGQEETRTGWQIGTRWRGVAF